MLLLNHLPNQAPDEKILLVLRRHSFIICMEVGVLFLLAALPLAGRLMLDRFQPTFFDTEPVAMVATLFSYIWELFVWLFLYRAFIDYYLDVWIVTNVRIINIEQEGLFSRHVSEQKLFRVQDVTAMQKGIFATFLDYGDVVIQTAAEQQRFHFEQVPDPMRVAQRITEIVETEKKHHHVVAM